MIELVIRIVIDTNVWISAFINPSGPPGQLIARARQGEARLVLSNYLIDEIQQVCRRNRVQRRLRVDIGEIDRILEQCRVESIVVETFGTVTVCRDADDNAILETAINGRAHYLISRDDDLKRDPALIGHLASFGVEVISVARFLELLDAPPA